MQICNSYCTMHSLQKWIIVVSNLYESGLFIMTTSLTIKSYNCNRYITLIGIDKDDLDIVV